MSIIDQNIILIGHLFLLLPMATMWHTKDVPNTVIKIALCVLVVSETVWLFSNLGYLK